MGPFLFLLPPDGFINGLVAPKVIRREGFECAIGDGCAYASHEPLQVADIVKRGEAVAEEFPVAEEVVYVGH